MGPDLGAVLDEADGGDELVGAAAQGTQLGAGGGDVGGFVEELTLAGEDLVGADDEGAGGEGGDAGSLRMGELLRGVGGVAGSLGFDAGFVDIGRHRHCFQAGRGEHGAPGGRAAGEDQPHNEFLGLWG